ncbi:hypothetical protein KJ969_03850 [Patescibacteria group bacterium]|nr:hypothetical protein [Patescibacteria group bacterium]MBU1921753.1 hypothetical protein [Patescibacteria group bacterium]
MGKKWRASKGDGGMPKPFKTCSPGRVDSIYNLSQKTCLVKFLLTDIKIKNGEQAKGREECQNLSSLARQAMEELTLGLFLPRAPAACQERVAILNFKV